MANIIPNINKFLICHGIELHIFLIATDKERLPEEWDHGSISVCHADDCCIKGLFSSLSILSVSLTVYSS